MEEQLPDMQQMGVRFSSAGPVMKSTAKMLKEAGRKVILAALMRSARVSRNKAKYTRKEKHGLRRSESGQRD